MKNKYVTQYNAYFTGMCKRRIELTNALSICDLKQQDILHFLELEKCDAVMLAKATKKLRAVRQERRDIKQELQVVDAICDRLKSTMKNEDFVAGVYKTDVIKEIKN